MKKDLKKKIALTEKLIIENFHKISKKLGMITEIEAVASDGGYYNKTEHPVEIDYRTLLNFKKAAENVFKSLSGQEDDGNFSPNNSFEKEILKNLIKNGLDLEHDNDEGTEYYWLAQKMDPNHLKDEINGVVDNLYDKVTYSNINDYFNAVIDVLIKLDSGEKLINAVKGGRSNDYIKSNFEKKFSPQKTGANIRDSWYGV